MPNIFEKRIRRAEQLSKEWGFAADLLRFYGKVAQFQRLVYTKLADAFTADPQGYFVEPLKEFIPAVLQLLEGHAPSELARSAAAVRKCKDSKIDALLWVSRCNLKEAVFSENPEIAETCAERILLEPFVVRIREHHGEPKIRSGSEARCPVCESPPSVSLLREDKSAETLRRTLICPLCSHEWDFPRVVCPACNEERPEKLPRYTAQEIPWMRVEACDSCHKYLKSVDLTQNWDAEPVVDELASTPLDVIAREHGYTKIAPNLAGI